nr:hypothetical protein [Lachnospiraceae bacterium]
MWCPKCKNEYRAGFTHCPDCDVDLVESLEEVLTPVIFGEKEPIDEMVAFLIANGIAEAACRKDEEDDTFELVVPAKDEKQTKELLNAFLMQKAMEQEREENGFEDEDDAEADDAEGEDVEEGEESDDDGEAGEALLYTGGGDEQEEDGRPGTYESKRSKAEEYRASAFALLLVGVLGAVAVALLYLDKLPFHLYGSSKVLICVVMEVMFVAF